MLNNVKHLANVSCQVPARILHVVQDDNIADFAQLDNCYIITYI